MDSASKTSDRDTSQLSDPPSDLDSSDSDAPTQQTEWLATTRKRRSTAGNRMKSMLANEEPDSDLELLFAEDENDQGFSDVDEDGSDVHMDSSSDDDDDNNANVDDLEGEEELERQAKEKRAAQRKRKAQEAIPAKFRKKVRIDPTTRASVPAPAPRPKKKSERASWLPSAADLPTRSSSRQTTRISKEQLHQQMAEREARRLKQLAQMEKKAARLEAMKKPPMTQEERLAEAAIVEKRNSKSLNRWEEAEKQREEERKAKLAALNQRTLKGPVITFWSGKGQWDDVELRSLRPYVTEVEEKPKKKREKLDKGAKGKGKDKESNKDGEKAEEKANIGDTSNNLVRDGTAAKDEQPAMAKNPAETAAAENPATTDNTDKENAQETLVKDGASPTTPKADIGPPETVDLPVPTKPSPAETAGLEPAANKTNDEPQEASPGEPECLSNETVVDTEEATKPSDELPVSSTAPPVQGEDDSVDTTMPEPIPVSTSTPISPSSLVPGEPSLRTPSSGLAAPAVPSPSLASPLAAPAGLSRPSETRSSSLLAAPALAPPAGIDLNGASPLDAPKSNVLAPPNTLQSTTPVPLHTESVQATPVVEELGASAATATVPNEDEAKPTRHPSHHVQPTQDETAPTSKSGTPRESEAPVAPEPPRDLDATRNCVMYQNFDSHAIRDKTIQTQILFGRKMTKLAKPAPAPICVITNNPARYRDPMTNLPFHDMYAYKEIQRLHNGDYQWSRVLGAWVGNTKHAARGVPERFLNPDSVTPPKTSAVPEDSGVKNEEKPGQKTDEAASKPAPGTNPIVKSEAEGSGQVAQPTPQVTVQ